MTVYNKVVRDNIPQIIEATGKKFTTRILKDQDFIKHLKQKCYEELNEYCAADTNEEAIEELADLMEIIRSLAQYHGTSMEEVEKLRQGKAVKRGGFEEKVFLVEVED
ncbi:phosphoribosyl-ATP pyrophosphohydrolase [Sutcliffiella sp. NPDC057660]|uniref:phosphoribosyl-ATP pyrophosphohydrolase n=1 Tax=Sutcliffiella sp. NPDC057660 TaxID=3346199 RepID=UPI00367A82AA